LQFSALQVRPILAPLHINVLSSIYSISLHFQAMSALLCCGHIFYTPHLQDDGIIYKWLDLLLTSKEEKVIF